MDKTSEDNFASKMQIKIEDELKQSYLEYSMSVIVGRALPDVRDGLKPVHRRCLHAMNELSNYSNKPYKKSARIVGDVIGKYHPHGDTAIYDSIVRMAQDFSLRYLLVDGQGNFGSVDGDSAASMRYTEIRMTKVAEAMLEDIDKDTVDFESNYDNTETIPTVLPAKVPNLLVNGSSGIAVGMATNIPSHNLGEVVAATIAMIDNPEIELAELMTHIKGPDFPTYGIIAGTEGIKAAYATGRGRLNIRSRTHMETKQGRDVIVVTELPYQVNKARLIEKIGELYKEKKIEGISALRDESDKAGMRVVVEMKRGVNAEVILNRLFKLTQLQVYYGINIVALDHGQPRTLGLRQILSAFIVHRREVVLRRTKFELAKARLRAHILEGLAIALLNIDPLIAIIKASETPAKAKKAILSQRWPAGSLVDLLLDDSEIARPIGISRDIGLHGAEYQLSEEQAQAILDMRLHKLTGLEQEKIWNEFKELLARIRGLIEIIRNRDVLMGLVKTELEEVKEKFGDERRTEILEHDHSVDDEDLIDRQEVVLTITQHNYIKIQEIDTYRAQKRGGRGKTSATLKDDDNIKFISTANTHDNLLCFTNRGVVYTIKVYKLPMAGRGARGRPLNNFLSLGDNESVTAILPVKEFDADKYLFMATSHGYVKKVSLEEFARPRTKGLIALSLNDGDELLGVAPTTGEDEVMLFTSAGKVIRFEEGDVRAMGRAARGVRGVKLSKDIKVIQLLVCEDKSLILTASSNGFGKRTVVSSFRKTGRGGQGVIAMRLDSKNGRLIAAVSVAESDELFLVTDKGTMVRTKVCEISKTGRSTKGVKLIGLKNGESLVSVQDIKDIVENDPIADEKK